MNKQLISLTALMVLATAANAQEGSSLTASAKGGSAASEAVSVATLNASTTSVEYSARAAASLNLNGEFSQGSSNASKDSSGQALGQEKGLAGSVGSIGASTVPTIVSVEDVTYQTSVNSSGSVTESITFHLSNEQGSVRVSADASKNGVSQMWEFSKGGVAASVNGTSEVIKSTGENVSNLSIAVIASGEILLIKAPSQSVELSVKGEIVEGSKVLPVQLSAASTTFSGKLDEEAKKN